MKFEKPKNKLIQWYDKKVILDKLEKTEKEYKNVKWRWTIKKNRQGYR